MSLTYLLEPHLSMFCSNVGLWTADGVWAFLSAKDRIWKISPPSDRQEWHRHFTGEYEFIVVENLSIKLSFLRLANKI